MDWWICGGVDSTATSIDESIPAVSQSSVGLFTFGMGLKIFIDAWRGGRLIAWKSLIRGDTKYF